MSWCYRLKPNEQHLLTPDVVCKHLVLAVLFIFTHRSSVLLPRLCRTAHAIGVGPVGLAVVPSDLRGDSINPNKSVHAVLSSSCDQHRRNQCLLSSNGRLIAAMAFLRTISSAGFIPFRYEGIIYDAEIRSKEEITLVTSTANMNGGFKPTVRIWHWALIFVRRDVMKHRYR